MEATDIRQHALPENQIKYDVDCILLLFSEKTEIIKRYSVEENKIGKKNFKAIFFILSKILDLKNPLHFQLEVANRK